jgi:hypothetical protein
MKSFFFAFGVVLSLAGTGVLMLGASLFADARSGELHGTGISVWVLDRWPEPGQTARLEVEGHGGYAVGIDRVRVWLDGRELASAAGPSASWGSTIVRDNRSGRASENVKIAVPIPSDAAPGRPLQLTVEVDYVCAVPTGAWETFDNVPYHDELALALAPVGAGGVPLARARYALQPLGLLALWALAVFGLVWLYHRRDDAKHRESLGVAVAGFMMCGGIVGYWEVARPLSAAMGSPTGAATVLIIAFVTGVPWGSWKLTKGDSSLGAWRLTAASEASGIGVDFGVLADALRAAGLTVTARPGRLSATGDAKTRVEVRGPDPLRGLPALQVRATRYEPVVHLAAALTPAFGAVKLTGKSTVLTVQPGERAEQVLARETERAMRELDLTRKAL